MGAPPKNAADAVATDNVIADHKIFLYNAPRVNNNILSVRARQGKPEWI
jgi:hypothetical protein